MPGLDNQALILVEQCLALPEGAARDDFLREQTAGKAMLRERVADLLSRTGLLETEDFLPAAFAPARLPERVGPFRIAGKIADGGMGIVLRGERDDGVYAQTVAIKLIKGDFRAKTARDRFEAERRILARLDHPAIARIVDGGSVEDAPADGGTAGLPWLAMEYVDGRPLTEALDAADAALDARLAAFLAVCEAVAVAHRAFVVHADIKPGNVLMRSDGAVKLLDFGIARLIVDLEDDSAAPPHPLTRSHAAPERAGGGAPTVAADIYSLGVLLREILPAGPGPDLAAIIAKAMRVDPQARYADVAALIEDLRAFRDHYPVSARDDSDWRYRTGKFLRRHRTGAIATAAIMLLLAGAASFSTLAYLRAERARVEAEHRFAEVRALSRFMLFDLYDDLADSPGTLPSRLRLADTARRYLEQLQRVPSAPLDLRLDTARGWRRLAAVEGLSGVSSLGRPDRARAALGRAEGEAQAILSADPDNAGALEELGWISLGRWTLLGDNVASTQMNDRGAAYFARALRIEPGRQEARLGLVMARRNRAYEMVWANRPGAAIPVARAALEVLRHEHFHGRLARDAKAVEIGLLSRIGDAVYYSGDIKGALPWYREQDATVRAELARHRSLVWTDKLGEAKFNLSGTLADLDGRRDEALVEAQAGVDAIERALAFGPDFNLERRLAILYAQQAIILEAMGRRAEAASLSQRGMDIRWRHLASAPSDPQNRRNYGVAVANHARLLAAAGRRADACAAVRSGDAQWRIQRERGDLSQRDAQVEVPAVRKLVGEYCGRR
jgi:serine/threonine-protein kinase